MPGFKIALPFAQDFLDVRLGLLWRLSRLIIGNAQPGELLPRIPQLAVGRFVELNRQHGLGVNHHNAAGYLFKERAKADFCRSLRLVEAGVGHGHPDCGPDSGQK